MGMQVLYSTGNVLVFEFGYLHIICDLACICMWFNLNSDEDFTESVTADVLYISTCQDFINLLQMKPIKNCLVQAWKRPYFYT